MCTCACAWDAFADVVQQLFLALVLVARSRRTSMAGALQSTLRAFEEAAGPRPTVITTRSASCCRRANMLWLPWDTRTWCAHCVFACPLAQARSTVASARAVTREARLRQVVVAGQSVHAAEAVRRSALGARLCAALRSGRVRAPASCSQHHRFPKPRSCTKSFVSERRHHTTFVRTPLPLPPPDHQNSQFCSPRRASRRRPFFLPPLPPVRGLACHCWRKHFVPE